MLNALGGGTAEEMVILRSRIGHLKFTAECFWALAIMGAVLSSVFLGVCAQSNDEGRSHSPASVSPYVRLQSQTQPVNVSIAQIDPSKFPIIELYALVTDQDGNSISGLTAGNFLVTEQSNLESSPTTESISVTPITGSGGITVALAFDKSGSMRGQPIIDAQAAANTFVDSLATLDRAAIISFGSPAVFHDPPAFTGDKDALHGIVNSLTDGGFTALYGAIYQAVTEINKEIGVKAVVIFSDGFSEGDTHTREQAVNLAKSSGVAVYTIGLGSNANESVLQIIADETGAYYTSSPTASDLQQIYDDIAQSIRDQYLVTYSTHNPNYDGTTRTVEVTATVGANSDSDSTTYSVTQPPQIDLTQDTTDLMSQAQYAGQALTIGAIITDDVLVTRAKLFYRKSGSGNIYTELEMTSSSDLYTADIPASGVVSPGVDFYVTATDGTLTSSVPQNNPATYPHQIAILPNQAPVIDHTPITTAAESTDIPISAKVTDTTDYVDHVKLFYRTSGYVLYDSLNMLPSSDTYTATIPGAKVTSAGVDYYIMASDNHTVKTYDGTDVSPHHINTANKLPVASAGPDQTITDTDGDGQESVTLDGSGSDDSDGTIANWVWTEGGTQIATGETPTVTLSVGTHTITLTVTDNDSATDTDEVTIVIASGHAVNSPSEPSGPRSGEADELLEFSTSISRCTKGHPVEYQFNWDSSGEDDLSEWSSSTSASHSYSSEGTYAVEARARCASDTSVKSGWSAPKTVIIGPPPDEHAPIAEASDIGGQPTTMHPDTFYTVTAKYYDVDGRDDLNICYLRLNYPSRRLTMMWYQVDGNYDCYAGDEGKSYLTISDVHPTEIPGSPEGYELAWTFKINDSWPEVENAIDFGVFASDDSGLDSGDWHYDDTNASFILEKTGTVTGRVTDASTGQGIDGVTLLLNPDPFIYSPGTSGGGYFSFSLPEGTYSITASASGYSSVAKSVTVTAGRPTEVDFALSKQERVPVIIIPGVPGSELLCNGDLIFPDLPTLALDYLPWVNRLLDCLKLAPDGVSPAHPQYDITVGNDIVRSLVETRIRVLVPSNPYTTLGGLLVDSKWEEKVIFGHDYFNGLINYLKGVGYREGSIYNATPGDLYVFPYDWRLDLRFSALRLGNAIKWVLENSNTTEVDIIAHSTGGLVSRYYLNNPATHPEDPFYNASENVRKLILIGVPNQGTTDAFIGLHPKLGRSLGKIGPFSVLTAKQAQEMASNFPSAYQLLPNDKFFDLYDYIFDDQFWNPIAEGRLGTPKKTYSENADGKLPNQTLVAKTLNEFQPSLTPDLQADIYALLIVGSGKPTERYIKKSEPFLLLGETWTAYRDNGDGTIPLESARGLTRSDGQRLGTLYIDLRNDGSHAELPSFGPVPALVGAALQGQLVPDDPRLAAVPFPCRARTTLIRIDSPVQLHVFDSAGGHTGPDKTGQFIEEGCAGSMYSSLGHSSVVTIPDDTDHTVLILGEDKGTFTLTISRMQSNVVVDVYLYRDIPVMADSVGALRVPGGGEVPSELLFDSDGDGSADLSIPAELGNSPLNLATPLSFYNGLITVSFDRITSAGHTVCQSVETLDDISSALNPVTPFYWLSTSALFSGSASITIHYDETYVPAGRESDLKLYRITGEDAMEDITLQLDQVANTVTGQTDGFSYFVVGYVDESQIIDNVIAGPNPVPDTGTAFFYTLPVGTSIAKLMVLSATSGRLLFETSIDVTQTRFPATGTWDPVDNDGVKLANGPYLYVLIANGQLIGQGKMVIQR